MVSLQKTRKKNTRQARQQGRRLASRQEAKEHLKNNIDNLLCDVMFLNAQDVLPCNALCVCVRVCARAHAVFECACHGKGLVALATQLNLVEFAADATVK